MDGRKIVELTDDEKTIMEYEVIILRFLQTGMLDRADAIAKCKKFNRTHPQYAAIIELQNALDNNRNSREDLTDEKIIYNMNLQLIYISGRNMLEGIYGLTR